MHQDQEEERYLREVITSLQWGLVEVLSCLEDLTQQVAIEPGLLERLAQTKVAVQELRIPNSNETRIHPPSCLNPDV